MKEWRTLSDLGYLFQKDTKMFQHEKTWQECP